MVNNVIMISPSVDRILASMEVLVLKTMELPYPVTAQGDLKVISVKSIALSVNLTLVSMEAPVLRVLAK